MSLRNEKIDVFIPTYNSEKHLQECLGAVKKAFPVRRIVLIDHGSTDLTLRIAEENGCEVVPEEKGLAYARELSFRLAETDAIALVESDLVYHEFGWYRTALGMLKEGVAAVVAYVPRASEEGRGKYNEFWSRYTPLRSRRHGFSAGSTLIRTEAVRGIRLPTSLNAYEDVYLLRALRKKGWKYRYIEVRGIHYSDESTFGKARWYGANARVLYSLEPGDTHLARRHLVLPAKGAVASLLTLDPRPFAWSVGFATNFFVGWSNPKLYRELRR